VGLNSECDIRVKSNRRQFYAVVNAADLGAEDNLPIRLMPGLERRLNAEQVGEVRFDAFTRGRYATDASHYQIMPLGVVTPRTIEEAERAIGICRAEGVPVTPRGGGTSQAGQTVNHGLVVDCSHYLDRVLDLDVSGRRCTVEPGIVLDELNRKLKPSGLWFPVDISTASRATIGGAFRPHRRFWRQRAAGSGARPARHRRARGWRDRAALSKGAAPRRWL
jgi:hypothetical protein